jgi:hypothetical protein
MCGATAGALLLVASRSPAAVRLLPWIAGAALLGTAAWTPAATILDVRAQREAFPSLGSFESRQELGRWSVEKATMALDARHATEGRHSLRLALEPGEYPGIELDEPPEDWSGLEELRFDVHLEGHDPLDLSIRIIDADHDGRFEDRFNGVAPLRAGPNRVRVPLDEVRRGPMSRTLDLHRVRGLMLFVPGLTSPRTLFLDDVRLVPRAQERVR